MTNPSRLLSPKALQDYLANGYITVDAEFPVTFHQKICRDTEAIFQNGNPGNAILPKIPALQQIFDHPNVRGALTSILGPDYVMHPHRHCHCNPPGSQGQDSHQDSYEDDENVRHHRTRWAMAFYYPQDVSDDMGPTALQPGTQYVYTHDAADAMPEIALSGKAGTVTIVHYDVWHRAMANYSEKNRYMMKFLFCRMSEPIPIDAESTPPNMAISVKSPHRLRHLWQWHTGHRIRPHNDLVGSNVSANLFNVLQDGPEADRIEAAYALAAMGENMVSSLIAALRTEAELAYTPNLQANHTNPSQLYTAIALSALGGPAVSALIDLLSNDDWWMRAAAADILGDMGLPAQEATPALASLLTDESLWVRRNAAEALGIIGNNDEVAILALTAALTDADHRVRHNAALALARIGEPARQSVLALRDALDDENLYVRENAAIALARIDTADAKAILSDRPILTGGGYHSNRLVSK